MKKKIKQTKKKVLVWREKKISKRPDRSISNKEKLSTTENVVYCSLHDRLGVDFNDDIRLLLREELEAWISSTSQVVYRLSLIFNRLILYLIKRNLPIPKLDDSLFTGLAKHGLKVRNKKSKSGFQSLIDDFCDNEFNPSYNQYPKIQRQQGDDQAINYACRIYKTNFQNTIFVPFFIRQNKFIKKWFNVMYSMDLSKKEVNNIQYQINGWKKINPDEIPLIKKFISYERQKLEDPEYVDDGWLKQRVNIVLCYYYHILQFYDREKEGKKFRLAPLCRIKSHSLTIDDIILKEILKNVRKKSKKGFPEWISSKIDEKDMTDEVWKAVFKYDGLKKKRRFTHHVNTDGEKICFHFRISNKKIRKRDKRRRIKKSKKKNTKERVIAIDPGRVNLVMAYDFEQEKYYRLTRGYYYRASGMKHRNKKANKRNLEMLKGVHDKMSMSPTKSIKEQDWYDYQQIVVRNYDKLWRVNTDREIRKDDFKTKRLKEKCLDTFFNKFIIKGKPKPVIAYGGAEIKHTGKGELSVPVKYVYKKCKDKFKTIKVNEKYTTKMHHKCKQVTTEVRVQREHKRGLRWCPTCSELVSRDKNACKNIGEIYMREERPSYLGDTYDRPNRRRKELKGCNLPTQK